MDVVELLNFKPKSIPKRPQDKEEDPDFEYDYATRRRKLRRLGSVSTMSRDYPQTPHPAHPQFRPPQPSPSPARRNMQPNTSSPERPPSSSHATVSDGGGDEDEVELISEEERRRILEMVEAEPEAEALDENSLKRMILSFEKRALRNQEMRIKFPELPEKFMESELELHEGLQELHALATAPDLYPIFVEMQAVPSLLGLLSHENTDISVAVVDLLQELTDVDTLNESEEGAEVLIDTLLEHQICALLVQNLERLDENVKEESDGVHNTLGIIENLTEFKPDVCLLTAQQGLLGWLLKRLKAKMPFDGNKLYSSEILSILLQGHQENHRAVGEMDGIDVLLQQLAFYKRHDPSSAEEQETMENLFNCLCSCLMLPPNRERFLKGEGLQLMNLMLREKKLSRSGALKVLNHAMSGPHGKENSTKFVDILGLRTIFPLFMKTPHRNHRKGLSAEEHEEHVLSIISSMLRNCKGSQRQRLQTKFTENDHEKVDRLMELHFKYLDKVQVVDAQIDRERENSGEDDEEDDVYLRRLEGGLFTLQLVDYVLLEVCASGTPSVRQRVLQTLNLRGASVKTIRHIMREYAGNLGEEGDDEWKQQEQQHILQLVDKF